LTLAWAHDPDDRPKLDYCIITLRELIMKKSTQISNENNQQINKYEILSSLGQGGQAQVFLVKEKSSSNLYALKKFHPKKLSSLNETLQEVQKQIFFNKQQMRAYVGLNHPNIIQIKDFFISNVDKHGFCNFNIVMEYCLI
jgi:serine/threonine protein kinase